MRDASLHGRRILVAEDEYVAAIDVQQALQTAGAEVLGPVATVDRAVQQVDAHPLIDGAVLDVNLCGQMIFRAADMLIERGVPCVLATGYESGALPERYRSLPRCQKPYRVRELVAVLARAIAAPRSGGGTES